MTTLTREQQIEKLRQMGGGSFGQWTGPGTLVIAGGLAIGGWVMSWVALYVVAAFFAVVGFTSFTTMQNVRNAVRGEREGARTHGRVQITVIAGTDAPIYSAAARDRGVRWSFEFVPLDWTPVAGDTEAQLVYVRGVEWPVLLLVENGIIVPRYRPKRT